MEEKNVYAITVQKPSGRERICCVTTRPTVLKRSVVYLLHKGVCQYDGSSRTEMVRRFRRDWMEKKCETVNQHLIGCRIDCFPDGGMNDVL